LKKGAFEEALRKINADIDEHRETLTTTDTAEVS